MRAILIAFLLCPFSGFTQETAPEKKPERLPVSIKTSPLNLINFFQQSIDVLAEFPIAERWAVELGVDFVLESTVFAPYKGEVYKGYKFKPAIKYYFNLSDLGNDFISLAFKYNDIHNDRYINVVRQGRQYTEWMLQRTQLDTWGVTLRMGTQSYLGKKRRLLMEPFIGLGFRQLRVTRNALAPDAEFLSEGRLFNWNREPGTYSMADLLIGFNMGWVLYRRH